MPQELVNIKNNNNKSLVWDSTLARIVDSVLCFLWQDNVVLGMTTAYSLHDRVLRERKRPSLTSTNACIVRPVFGDAVKKKLFIPTAIDAYNHHMNGVDLNNQLRLRITVCRPFERRTWRPLWNWLLDICCVNAFLIWQGDQQDLGHRAHRQFRRSLCDQLLLYSQKDSSSSGHYWSSFKKRNFCIWCKKHAEDYQPRKRRKFGTEIDSNARFRGVSCLGGCKACGVYLCRKGACFERYHSQRR